MLLRLALIGEADWTAGVIITQGGGMKVMMILKWLSSCSDSPHQMPSILGWNVFSDEGAGCCMT